jgi:hypothetical protein
MELLFSIQPKSRLFSTTLYRDVEPNRLIDQLPADIKTVRSEAFFHGQG